MRKEKKSLYLVLILMCIFCASYSKAQDISPVPSTASVTTLWVSPDTLSQEVTPVYKNYFRIQQPEPDTITTNKTVLFKGENLFHTKVFIDNQEVKRNKSGRFEHPLTFNDYGKHVVLITFTLPDYKAETLSRKILYLRHAEEVVSSTFYFSDLSRSKAPSESVCRAELAYFLANLMAKNEFKIILENRASLSDIPETHWAQKEIKQMVKKGILTPFSDGTFRPDSDVSKIDYIIAVVRALDIGLSSTTVLPYSDIEHNWMMPYVKGAYRKGIIPDAKKLLPREPLTEAQFIAWSGNIKNVADEVKDLLNFSKGYTLTENDISLRIEPVLSYFKTWREHDLALAMMRASQDRAAIGAEAIPVVFHDKKISISSLPSYPDLDGHWIRKIATELRYLKILDADAVFEPKKIMTEQDVSLIYLKAFNALPPIEFMTFQPEHVVTKAEVIKLLQSMTEASAFTPTKKSVNRPITKAEFVALLGKTRSIQALIKESFEP
ncbi:MAG: S-layer homology domain-containing protein [Candidatus Margulisbacteria bacterium]|nr:S-layer homology domain-containing protein [Candidatus Margulisiibacteriota bacterium]